VFLLNYKITAITGHYNVGYEQKHSFSLEFIGGGVSVMVFYATFSTISVVSSRSVLLVEETGILGENYRPVASH
jgi:hypothetical protein